MVAVSKALFITDKIMDCHTAARRLFGDQYHGRTKAVREAMQDLKDKTGCSNVAAGMAVLEFMEAKNKLDAMLILLVSAVMYDMVEESEATNGNI